MEQRKYCIPTACIIVVVISGIIILATQFAGTDAPSPHQSAPVITTLATPITTILTPAVTTAKVLNGSLSKEEATARLGDEDLVGDTHGYSVAGVTLTDRYPGRILYEFTLVPDATHIREINKTVFIDAETGDSYIPLQEMAGITISRAKEFALRVFPEMAADRVRLRFNDGSNYNRGWAFYLYKDGEKLVQGTLVADTGELDGYTIGVKRMGRPESPSIAMDAARLTADKEIRKRNGELPLELADSRLNPLGMPGTKIAGNYVFVYKRVIDSVLCDSDGILVTVDSVAGNVVGYHKAWTLPENAVAGSSHSAITKDAAIKTVEQDAVKIYPASAASLKIVSADLRWKDFHNPDKVTPAPGSIPLAWKVQFDDETLRAQQYPTPGYGWVDAQNGTLLDIYYRHEH